MIKIFYVDCKANYEVDWSRNSICLGYVLTKMFPVAVKPITKLIGRNALGLGLILIEIFPCVERCRVNVGKRSS